MNDQYDLFEDVIARIKFEPLTRKQQHAQLLRVVAAEQEGWREATVAWAVCVSVHETWAKGKDALYLTRHADFERHLESARQKTARVDSSVAS